MVKCENSESLVGLVAVAFRGSALSKQDGSEPERNATRSRLWRNEGSAFCNSIAFEDVDQLRGVTGSAETKQQPVGPRA